MPTLTMRFILMGFFLLASVAFAATGEYQQTRDDKTTVWNGSPKSGESSAWAGARDKEGYATGFGTITWYTSQGKVYAMYYGNMIRGKLDGPVNAHSRGKTAHAYFADGGRVTEWARGPAPARRQADWPVRAQRVEEPKAEEAASETKPKKTKGEQTASEVVAETKSKKPNAETETLRATERVAEKPEEKEGVPSRDTAKTQTSPKSDSRETAERTPEEIKQPPAVAAMHTASTPEPTQTAPPFSEPPKIAESQESPIPAEAQATPEPSVEEKIETTEQPAREEPTAKSETDASLSALTGPPSSLRSGSIPESPTPTKSETKSRSTSSRSGTHGIAHLSEDEAIGLADIEARAKGYDLGEYQRPKADYSAVKDKWSLFYNLKDAKAGGGDLQPFSVTVEDKTKKVEIRRNY
jgi:hypothetical protein